jgi:hypothetical protein
MLPYSIIFGEKIKYLILDKTVPRLYTREGGQRQLSVLAHHSVYIIMY